FIEDKIDLTKQTLIIVPEISDADKLYESLPKKLRDLTTIYTSQISEKEMFEKWLGIWNGETKIIIGTRNTIFLSYFSLTEIIIDQSFHFGHKSWDAAPRFNSKDAALILAKHLGAHLSLISHTPSVEEFYFATNDVYSFFDEKLPGIKRLPSVINMKQEFRAKNFSNFSLPLQDEINNNKTGSIFLYCNRRGSASYVSCRDCAKVLKCNVCSRPYIYYEKFSELRCHHCNTKTAMNPTCSECKGTNLAFYGAGTSGIAAEYKKLFPDEKREILEIDKDIFDLDTFNDNKDRVIIGTQFAWSYLNWNNISVMAMMDADTPLYTPEYLGSENLWFSIHDAIFRLPEQSSLYIQTRHSDHPVYEYLNSPQLFYDRELAERKLFGYPPFKFLLKLFLSDENAGNLDKECRKFYQNLQQLTKNSPDIKINSPVSIFPPIIKGKYSQAIIIKLSYKNYKKSLKHILEITPDNWKADPNPINLLSL
ncbi:MAG: primosomal protein N', partial [Candidatus Magasanikbacteria bacterium]